MQNEDFYLAELQKKIPAASSQVVIGPGDDCAAFVESSGELLLVALDQVVEGRHYLSSGPGDDLTTKPELVGRKLLARNLSDIAAMGGSPSFCLVGLAVSPRHFNRKLWLDRFFDGLLLAAAENQVQLIGGDLAEAMNEDVGSLTIIGRVPADQVCRRAGAKNGDCLFATGEFGDSFQSGYHLRFIPRWREGRWLAENRFPRAMIDVSDGLLLDSSRLAHASGLSLRLKLDDIPLRTPGRPVDQAIVDGEDYELLFAVANDRADKLKNEWPFPETPLTEIGTFCPKNQAEIMDEYGNSLISSEQSIGYDHFSG